MSIAPFLVSLFLLGYLDKQFKKISGATASSAVLRWLLLGCVVLLCVEVIFSADSFTRWIWDAALILLAVFMYLRADSLHTRTVLSGVAPFITLTLFSDVLEITSADNYRLWDDYIETAFFFSFLWMGAMWISHNKQQKALEKDRIRRDFEEAENKAIAQRKEQLEIMVNERTQELLAQKESLQKALEDLSLTQNQLIQQEKLASLGELTAGIAHEIQNPLNFVNNFSEVSAELVDELREEQQKELRNLDNENQIMEMLKDNLGKIRHHGKRADGIVKGMLQHSRTSSGKMESVDLNALADEYLRLSYHGLRARDKSFNATIITDFDPGVGSVNVLPQDMGRVILNLLTNAFYSVNQQLKTQPAGYEPTVWVSTKKLPRQVQIIIKDNGLGIPAKMIDKIYQPFFTTKPTGEGTGLGLSLSYDIITKGHSGEMILKSKEGEFAEFRILIPAV